MRINVQARGLWRALLLACLLASIVLAGCSSAGGSPASGGGAGATSALATAAPTFTPTPQATVSPAQVAQACGTNNFGNPQGTFYQLGDLYIAVTPTGLTYPSRKLPDGTPLKPFKLNSLNDPGLSQQLPVTPLVNPYLSSGYFVDVCDAASTTHHIEGVAVQIASFTPYTGDLNSWQLCDGWYTNGQLGGGGCGGAFTAQEYLKATFSPTAGAGTSIPATFLRAGTGANGQQATPLPLSLQPANELFMNVAIAPPTVAGYYQFAFSVKVDGANSPFVTDPEIFLIDPQAHKWSGAACQAPAMKSQIPSDGGYYICPE